MMSVAAELGEHDVATAGAIRTHHAAIDLSLPNESSSIRLVQRDEESPRRAVSRGFRAMHLS